MVRHEDYSKQNQNKVPELSENVIICIFYIWLYLIISVEAPATWRGEGNPKHVLVVWVEGQGAISGD